jgi:hypothetical protein
VTSCPFCGCDRVYPLLNTLRCKRCKGIWKAGDGPDWPSPCCPSAPGLGVRKKTDPLEKRLQKRLDEYLARPGGRFCFATLSWQAGDITRDQFGRYLRQCVKNKTLAETKDGYGRVWYSRPG